ncbi:MAG: TerC family protein [Candidatus Melainabacteria bacterium]
MPDFLSLLSNPQTYISLATLTLLEIVLGIDNIIFISILAAKLPEENRQRARVIGLVLALVGRLVLLSSIAWLTTLTEPLVHYAGIELSGKDIVLLLGGLFLIYKASQEMYEKVECTVEQEHELTIARAAFAGIVAQIIFIDIVFSLDSIITAVGLVKQLPIMFTAVIISMFIMIWAAPGIGDFIDRHPSVKILALSFLLMIGTLLVAEAFGYEIPKGYVYFSLAFSLFVESINIRMRNNHNKKIS